MGGDSVVKATRQPGGGGVLYYRVYFLDRYSGHIDHFREFEASTDADALMIAESWRGGGPMELWNRHRKLKHWNEQSPAED